MYTILLTKTLTAPAKTYIIKKKRERETKQPNICAKYCFQFIQHSFKNTLNTQHIHPITDTLPPIAPFYYIPDAMNHAITYNNCGLKCVVAGDLNGAIDLFRKAVDIILHASQEPNQTTCENDDIQDGQYELNAAQEACTVCCGDQFDLPIFHKLQDAEVILTPLPSFSGTFNDPYSIFVYQNGFSLKPLEKSQVSTNKNDPTRFQLESTVILYNMGLAYHLKHLEGKQGGNKLQIRSAKLYHHALDLSLSSKPTRQEEKSFAAHLQVCALNNMGALFHEMGFYENSSECMRDMSEFIRSSALSEYPEYIKWDFFTMNAMILVEPSTASAA